jgi:hypothetical protein
MRRHRIAVPVLLAVAVVTGFLAIFATWAKRQVLDTGNWTDTSAKLLADDKIQAALGSYLVAELFSNVDVASQLQAALPPQLEGLAGPASGGLRQVADQRAPKFLARPRVQDAWVTANRAAHKQLLAVLDDKGNKAVSTANGDVVIDTRQMLQQLANDVGIGKQIPTLPPKVGQLVVLRSDQLKTAQDITTAVRGLSIGLTIISLGLFALAVWLAQGWRRVALRSVGWSFVGLGVATLVLRRAAGNQVVDGLVQAESVKPAAHDAFLIASSLLHDIAVAMVIYGLVIIAAAWLAGPTRSGVAVRRLLAPPLRERLGMVYGAVGFAYLLVLAWGPTPALRNVIPILLIGILLVLGVEALRRQIAREFPAVQPADDNGRPPTPPGFKPDKEVVLGPS